MVSRRKGDPSGKKVSKLYVEPNELARKLLKELDGTRVSQGGQTWVRDQYTVFLCREDFARFRSHLDQLVRKLESHMEKHVQNKRYATSGAITVELTMDPDLKPGYFGVLVEKADLDDIESPQDVRPPQGRSIWDVQDDTDHDDDLEERHAPERPAPSAGAPPLDDPAVGAPLAGAAAAGLSVPALPGVPSAPGPAQGRPSPPPLTEQPPQAAGPATGLPTLPQTPPQVPQQASASPQIPQQTPPQIPPPVPPAASAGRAAPVTPEAQTPVEPAAEPLVLKVNGQERMFPQGKVVVGRSRDADLQIDNADVSRRHALIYWSEGGIVVKDLGSTNGTMVNGYPVDKTVVRPTDVIRIGNAHITATPK